MAPKTDSKKIRKVIYLTPDDAATLDDLRQGESASSIVRKAIRLLAFGEAQVKRQPSQAEVHEQAARSNCPNQK